LYLTEDLTNGPNDSDNTYGWAKLMAEFTLKPTTRNTDWARRLPFLHGIRPARSENHAVIAIDARANYSPDAFEVWGDGTQIRNWTYMTTLWKAPFLPEERIDDGTPAKSRYHGAHPRNRRGAHGLRTHRPQSGNQAA